MFDVKVPIVSVVIGEGGSGGALGIAIADRVLMMEYSTYSVISPESCASILWADPKNAEIAANALQLSPNKAFELGVVDGIIAEPAGGAHRRPDEAIQLVKSAISKELKSLSLISREQLVEERFQKFRQMGNKTLIDIKE
jgi:acetyl-CoA carboxylase carboxyl transferase subunit alpha